MSEQEREVIKETLGKVMALGTSGRWIASYGETPETIADLIAARLASESRALAEARERLAACKRLAEELQDYNPGHGDFHTAGNRLIGLLPHSCGCTP